MLARRLLVLVVVLMGLTLLAALLTPVARRPTVATPDTGGAAAPEQTVEITLDGSDGRHDADVEEGENLVLRVTSDTLDSVELSGLGMIEPVAPDTPAEFNLIVDHPGNYPIVLTDADRTVGTLHVTPKAG